MGGGKCLVLPGGGKCLVLSGGGKCLVLPGILFGIILSKSWGTILVCSLWE